MHYSQVTGKQANRVTNGQTDRHIYKHDRTTINKEQKVAYISMKDVCFPSAKVRQPCLCSVHLKLQFLLTVQQLRKRLILVHLS